jgi:hypothetical protein
MYIQLMDFAEVGQGPYVYKKSFICEQIMDH